MTTIKRNRIQKKYSGLYKHYLDEDSRRRCYYCGDPADTIDHVPSLECVYSFGSDFFINQNIKFWLIPACKECNCLIKDKPFHTIANRADYLWITIEKRYNKVLNGMSFTNKELEEFGPNLRDILIKQQNISDWIERRLPFLARQFFD